MMVPANDLRNLDYCFSCQNVAKRITLMSWEVVEGATSEHQLDPAKSSDELFYFFKERRSLKTLNGQLSPGGSGHHDAMESAQSVWKIESARVS